MISRRRRPGGVAVVWIIWTALSAPVWGDEGAVRFSADVRPILAERCFLCHGPDASHREADLRLDLEASAKEGRERTAAIVPGKPEASELFRRITSHAADERMPPADAGKPLTTAQVEILRRWIAEGAPYQQHWSFRPVTRPALPAVKDATWPARDLDNFVLARLEQAGLRPAPDADRQQLLRRVYFDLIGLPPSPQQLAAFVADSSPRAYDKVVDQLLASPHFGERWARHWLDLVRYAETFGYEHDWPIPLAWRYRDYVIRMFNEDVPYDQIVREHICGDLLDTPRRNSQEGFNESIIATGFWYLHGQMSQPVDVLQHEADRFDNQIDVYSRAFLGLTLACSRCHDHKFDPLSTQDYYGIQGFLRSSRRQEAHLDPGEKIAAVVAELAAVRREADAALAALSPSGEAQKPAAATPAIAGTVVFEDFNRGDYKGWLIQGQAFGDAPTGPRQWDRAAGGARAVEPGLAHSGMLSGKLQGTLQSPEFTIRHPQIWLRVSGKGTVRAVINGYMLQRYKDQLFVGTEVKFDVPANEFRWIALDRDLKLHLGQTAYLEIEDDSDAVVVVDEIRFADKAPPKESTPRSSQPIAAGHDTQFAALAKKMAALEARLVPPMRVLAICEGTPSDVHVNVRGNVRRQGAPAPRRMPVAIYGNSTAPPDHSGRLEWGARMLHESDPLLPRVRVNWVWHHLLGRGIVSSVDNFGALGEPPTHPQLLDYLAARFRSRAETSAGEAEGMGWSLKRLVREIVLSRTYRMSSKAVDAEAERADPNNALLHRARVRRLEGEAIRDAMLAVSGRLDKKMYGPPVPVHLTAFMQGLGRPDKSGPLDGAGRRSVYLEVRRNFLAPMFAAFDAPNPATCVARRSVSNVPAQALIMMNDPFVAEQAAHWGRRVLKEEGERAARVDRMYLAAFARPATPREQQRAEQFIRQQAAAYEIAPQQAAEDERVWADFAHALFGVKEFIFVR
jgi:hypothetical protein